MISVFRYQTSLVAQTVKRLPTSGRPRFDPWVGKILWRRKWHPTPVLLPGKFHGQRNLVDYSTWDCKESDTTEQLHLYNQKRNFWMEESESEVAQSCPTLCNPMDCSLPGSSIHGIFQARVLEWGAISFSRGSSQPRDRTWVSHKIGRAHV